MLVETLTKTNPKAAEANCDKCSGPAEIVMIGYGDDASGDCYWCADCAMQLARKLLEDLCELKTKGGRNG